MKLTYITSLCLAALAGATALAAPATGIVSDGMDKSVRAQDDLYLSVNGAWLQKAEIPADKSNYGAFTALEDLSRERIRAIIEAAAASTHEKGTDAQKVGDMYRSFMDQARIEQLGLKPLQGELAKIAALSDKKALAAHFGYLQQLGVQAPFGFYVAQDDKDSTRYMAQLYQWGTALPDRDYYLKDDAKFKEARAAYLVYLEKLLTLSGSEPAAAKASASAILEFETQLAKAQRTKVELRDPEKNYNKTSVADLAKIAPKFDWTGFMAALDASAVSDLNLGQPDFVKAADAAVDAAPLETLKAYLRVKLLDAYAIALPASFEEAHFNLHGKVLAGIPAQKPRWKKAVDLIGGAGAGDFGILGDVVGRLYVEKYFPAQAKARMDELVKNLLAAYDHSIGDLTWMTPETKAKARLKLSKYMTKIGYPTKWRDYSKLEIDADSLMGNLFASARLEFHRNVDKLGQPIDRQEWGMTPQTVNAYYNPGLNEIVFPAAILQPPFFNADADDAVNYGGIGAVIGHEISHGFDDQGSQYDGDGNLKNWWTDADRKAFTQLTEKLVAQYNACEALPGKFVNGQLTLGENIADNSGLSIAYKAYKISLGGKPAPVLDGLTGDQRFFMGWSQVWRRKYREPEMVKRLLTDPHSPSQFRANCPVMNSDAFAEAFGLKPGDKLYKPSEERIRIW